MTCDDTDWESDKPDICEFCGELNNNGCDCHYCDDCGEKIEPGGEVYSVYNEVFCVGCDERFQKTPTEDTDRKDNPK